MQGRPCGEGGWEGTLRPWSWPHLGGNGPNECVQHVSTTRSSAGPIHLRQDRGFPGRSDGKESAYNEGDPVRSLGWEDPLRREWLPT